jgi:hypothetical protein
LTSSLGADYSRAVRLARLFICAASLVALALPSGALAQDALEGVSPEGPGEEEPDPTRLDVERLPPEAIEVTRDLYSHGFFLEAAIGGRGFLRGAGSVSNGGPMLSVGGGYELSRWLWVRLAMEASMHETSAPAPPDQAVFEVLGLVSGVRFQIDLSARSALFAGGEFGLVFVTDDVLRSYGIEGADRAGIVFGGELGFDWHFRNKHQSIGFLGGTRLYPSLEGFDGAVPFGVHGLAYLRYVFGS